ncbi:hypothetical protein F0562_002292 [Nyssa sinensis]|uniref:RIN4 pathogenic type III effector avirulence factor Avr cleavage site domain-containing protein n=1 Tax=Nyssa sinensis TaxID=561372 RepID=A0A5J5C5L8_9ASTE|nr:hypothetical protein F0562_002292 [Nyssa sinensis]
MAQHPHVPKFGNWESEENVPYTVYFEKARKGRTGGKMINPNDPQENPDMFSNIATSAEAPPPSGSRTVPEEPIGGKVVRPTDEPRVSREDGDIKQFSDSPARNENMGRKAANEPTRPRHGGRGSSHGHGRPTRDSAGSEHSMEWSPLHPHYQARIAGKGSGSPSWEGKSSNESSHATHGKSRLKPVTRGDESPDKGAAVPKFGEWDEKNPSAAESYTHIFNRVREERHIGTAKVPAIETESSNANAHKPNPKDNSKCRCFPW